MEKHYVFCLPVNGNDPYRVSTRLKPTAPELQSKYQLQLEMVLKMILSNIEHVPSEYCQAAGLEIQPLLGENPKWFPFLAGLRNHVSEIGVYVNRIASTDCLQPNEATLIKNYFMRPFGCDHMIGDVVLVIPATLFLTLDVHGIGIDAYDRDFGLTDLLRDN
jgi:hypothetical protein